MRENFQRRSFAMSENQIDFGIKAVSYSYEVHPFEPFIKEDTKVLIVGTCPPHRFCIDNAETQIARESGSLVEGKKSELFWFYGSSDNNLWKEINKISKKKLNTIEEIQNWCVCNRLGFMDLFHTVQRYKGLASDTYISPIKVRSLTQYLLKYTEIEHIFFTSEWAMNIAKKEYLEENFTWLKRESMKTDGVFEFQNGRKDVNFYHLSSPSPNNTSNTRKGWDFLKSCIDKNNS